MLHEFSSNFLCIFPPFPWRPYLFGAGCFSIKAPWWVPVQSSMPNSFAVLSESNSVLYFVFSCMAWSISRWYHPGFRVDTNLLDSCPYNKKDKRKKVMWKLRQGLDAGTAKEFLEPLEAGRRKEGFSLRTSRGSAAPQAPWFQTLVCRTVRESMSFV